MRTSSRILTVLFSSMFFYCCLPIHHEGEDNVPLKHTNDLQIKVMGPDTVEQEKYFTTFLHVDNPKYQIKTAYFDCNLSTPATVDTVQYIIKGCHANLLLIERDTIKFSENPMTNFGETTNKITLLVVDHNNNWYYDTCTIKSFIRQRKDSLNVD